MDKKEALRKAMTDASDAIFETITDYEEEVISFETMREQLLEQMVASKTLKNTFFTLYPEGE